MITVADRGWGWQITENTKNKNNNGMKNTNSF
jgi:hypothetical protein